MAAPTGQVAKIGQPVIRPPNEPVTDAASARAFPHDLTAVIDGAGLALDLEPRQQSKLGQPGFAVPKHRATRHGITVQDPSDHLALIIEAANPGDRPDIGDRIALREGRAGKIYNHKGCDKAGSQHGGSSRRQRGPRASRSAASGACRHV